VKEPSESASSDLPSAKEQGQRGEALALRFLYRQGYDILDRNFRCRAGEIDLIAYDGPVLAFIEVKSRSSQGFGTPAEALVPEQQERIQRAAATYRRSRRLEHLSFRFDLVSVDLSAGRKPVLKLIRNAF